jgi:hypothetical protein
MHDAHAMDCISFHGAVPAQPVQAQREREFRVRGGSGFAVYGTAGRVLRL